MLAGGNVDEREVVIACCVAYALHHLRPQSFAVIGRVDHDPRQATALVGGVYFQAEGTGDGRAIKADFVDGGVLIQKYEVVSALVRDEEGRAVGIEQVEAGVLVGG
jgi:hypothetical protein